MEFGLFLVMLTAQCCAVSVSGQGFILRGVSYANGATVQWSDIGEGENGLICITTQTDCCGIAANGSIVPDDRRGDFYYPDGTRVPTRMNAGSDGFFRGRGHQFISLQRLSSPTTAPPTGPYRCDIPDRDGDSHVDIFIFVALASSPPSSPTNVSTTPQSTSITITWTQPEEDVVDNYVITYSYQGPCPGVSQSEGDSIGGNRRQFVASDLYGYSNYTITIIVSNGAGISPPVTITIETLTAAPSGSPRPTATSVTPFSITIQWSEIDCHDWNNAELTGYSIHVVQYRKLITSVTLSTRETTFTANGLIPRTTYNFEVAVVSESGTGPYRITSLVTAVPTSVGLLLNGVLYGNNSIVTLDEIGKGSAALFCLTNKTDCCHTSDTGAGVIGNWFYPDRRMIYYQGTDIYRDRGRSSVILQRRNDINVQKAGPGVFRCEVPDASGTSQQLYVGVYPVNSGSPSITNVGGLLYYPLARTLYCNSVGGPATTVTWRKNGAVVEVDGTTYSQSQRILDTMTATYENTLYSSSESDFVGNFTCTVSNSRGSSSMNITLRSVSIHASQSSLTVGQYSESILCTSDLPTTKIEWLNSGRMVVNARRFQGASRAYRIQNGNFGQLTSVEATSTDQLDLTFRPVNDSIHNSNYICSVTIGDRRFEETITITVRVPPDAIEVTIATTGSTLIGQEHTLECQVSTLIPGLANTPTATWLHGDDATPISSGDDGIIISPTAPSSTSTLSFTPGLTTSHAGEYICEGRLESPALDTPLTVRETQNVIVKLSPPASVFIITSPDDDPFIVAGSSLTLTCSIELSEAVDIAVTVNTVWSGPSDETQFTTITSVATMMTATTYTSTATISSVETSDSGEYTCTATVTSTSNPYFSDSNKVSGIKNITVKRSLHMFQLKLLRTDDCATWSDDKAYKFERSIQSRILKEITSRCYCRVPEENLLPGSFSCHGYHNQTTYRSTIIGTQSYNATQLVEFIQDWVTSDPTLTIQWYTVKLDSKCPVSISSLGEPECGVELVSPEVARCVDVCVARSRPLQ